MNNKIKSYISAIIDIKGGSKNLLGIPTDIIGFNEFGKNLANELEKYVTRKEICFFDEIIKDDDKYHYLDFNDMLEKSELMIFLIDLDISYFDNLDRLNKSVSIIVDGKLDNIINVLSIKGFSENTFVVK